MALESLLANLSAGCYSASIISKKEMKHNLIGNNGKGDFDTSKEVEVSWVLLCARVR